MSAGSGAQEVAESSREAVPDPTRVYRQVREELERGILPLATSVDGRRFTFQASLRHLRIQTGGYVVLEESDGQRLGQVLTMETDSASTTDLGLDASGFNGHIRFAHGEGVILDGGSMPFLDAPARPAEPAEVSAWLRRVQPGRAPLTVGDLLLAPGVPATIDPGGFNRHTFMCGQSGSGKTYSLGLVLEQLLVGTSLQMIILDPNSDYVRLAEVREGADAAVAADYAAAAGSVAVWQNAPNAVRPLQMQFIDLDPAAQAAVFGLDPIRDREEYAALAGILAVSEKGRPVVSSPDGLLS
jgi:uncharacterized protein DUF87